VASSARLILIKAYRYQKQSLAEVLAEIRRFISLYLGGNKSLICAGISHAASPPSEAAGEIDPSAPYQRRYC